MIRINLLPHKKIKPMDKGILRLWIVSIAVSAVVLLGVTGWYVVLTASISSVNSRIEEAQVQAQSLKKESDAVNAYKKATADLTAKLAVIDQIEKTKIPMTPVLSELNRLTAKDVWISSLTITDADFTINYLSVKLNAIAPFFESMKKSELLSNLALDDSAALTPEAANSKKYPFKVTGKIAGYENVSKPGIAAK